MQTFQQDDPCRRQTKTFQASNVLRDFGRDIFATALAFCETCTVSHFLCLLLSQENGDKQFTNGHQDARIDNSRNNSTLPCWLLCLVNFLLLVSFSANRFLLMRLRDHISQTSYSSSQTTSGHMTLITGTLSQKKPQIFITRP